jgi:uncharacterized protein YbaR (Trm112 family)/ubiquinone/menaquinone biosynthesis C-methylase UbiE
VKRSFLDIACCPECRGQLDLTEEHPLGADDLESGSLSCPRCRRVYPIVKGIPRFVESGNYSKSFGYQWTKFSRTQLDENLGIPLSAERFANETGWGQNLRGLTVLEAGSGMGRFTRCAAATGAEIVSLDYSNAIEANQSNNKHFPNIHFVQADLGKPPFRSASFDKVFCFGVLQHTPDPRQSLLSLIDLTKPGGDVVADVYRWTWKSVFFGQYYLRVITKRVPARWLFPAVRGYFSVAHALTGLVLPVNNHLSKIMSVALGTADYRGLFPVDAKVMREWCLLDTFDKLSPTFEKPQTIESVTRWFSGVDVASFVVRPGYNGIEIHVRR